VVQIVIWNEVNLSHLMSLGLEAAIFETNIEKLNRKL
jgi:hypothetical protein